MRPPEEEVTTLVAGWLRKADDDMEAANVLLGQRSVLGGIIAFHAQQAAEKYLKALLTLWQVPFPKTHDLGPLVLLLAEREPNLRDRLRGALVLSDYGVDVRYPGDLPEVSREEAEAACTLARMVSTCVREYLPHEHN